ncbi:MAG: zf-HC2 domain-containing protein [Planctomycetota bacterium]|nr:zf-HC2 domain-containing protein [Planctomycetota bacterium]
MTHACDRYQSQLPDHLDALLSTEDAETLEVHLESCAACRAAQMRAVALRDALYRPYDVDPLPDALRARIELAATQSRPARPVLLLRYAASFAAGVLVTLALTTGRADAVSSSPSVDEPTRAETPDPQPAIGVPMTPATPLRRIR